MCNGVVRSRTAALYCHRRVNGGSSDKDSLATLVHRSVLTQHSLPTWVASVSNRLGIRRCHQLRYCDIKKATKQGTLLHTKEWIDKLKTFNKCQILDLAKAGSISKIFTCIQGLWVITQAITRIYRHQGLAFLKVTTSAYICAVTANFGDPRPKAQNCSVSFMIACSEEEME